MESKITQHKANSVSNLVSCMQNRCCECESAQHSWQQNVNELSHTGWSVCHCATLYTACVSTKGSNSADQFQNRFNTARKILVSTAIHCMHIPRCNKQLLESYTCTNSVNYHIWPWVIQGHYITFICLQTNSNLWEMVSDRCDYRISHKCPID